MTQRRVVTAGCAAFMFAALIWGGVAGAQSTTPTAATPAGQTYSVQSGDNLSKIAQRFGVSLNALMDANNIRDPNVIRLGQVLNIPSGASVTSVLPPLGLVSN